MTTTLMQGLRSSEKAAHPVLEVRNLNVAFNSHGAAIRVVRDVSFSIGAGRTLVLLGESGSGKSVTARSLLALHGSGASINGSIRLSGQELVDLDEREMARLRGSAISLVSQDPSGSLDPLRKIGRQMVEVLLLHRVESNRNAAKSSAAELLRRAGIHEPTRVLESLPFELSGGMRQRVAIAMAISTNPQVLIADEPTTALDVTVQAQVLDLFTGLQQEFGTALLLVTHDVGVARMIGHDVAVMYAGRLVESGSITDVTERPNHPYTAGLLDAVPLPGIPRGQLATIPGRPPTPAEVVNEEACAFAPRCRFAVPECFTHLPKMTSDANRHMSACDIVDGVVPSLPRTAKESYA